MFTGIIRATSTIVNATEDQRGLSLQIKTPRGWKVRAGDSIATNGVCLTVSRVARGVWHTDLMEETLAKTTFGGSFSSEVNLEQSVRVGDRLDGHFVTGHIDTIGTVSNIKERDASRILTISFPKSYSHLVAPKGSIAIDGVSLTVVDATPGSCTVSLVRYTLEHTTLGRLERGSSINIEFDILSKYVASNRTRKI